MRGLVRELDELFQAVLLDHARRPRNQRRLSNAASGEGNDPLCGDRCTVYLDVQEGKIKDVSFEGTGCAIMLASASLLTLALAGKTQDQAKGIADHFQALLTREADSDNLGDLAALAGVRELPSRIKCALLPWRAMKIALQNEKSGN
jgi:nitrogen fixation NifU-like protein